MEVSPLEEQSQLISARLLAAREVSEKTLARVAEQLGVSVKMVKNYESGQSTPSLPQLEVLSELYRIPIENLLSGNPDLLKKTILPREKVNDFLEIRNRVIAATLKQQRLAQNWTIKKLAAAVGISAAILPRYESGETAIPAPILEHLCSQLGIPLKSLYSSITLQNSEPPPIASPSQDSSQLPEEVQSFIQNPANLPYLELAKRLSGMDATKLRAIAENLLEITF